ncbi:MAG: DUF2279 domain-containing protein [Alteromonadaceae bacterium]|nr:DUF2279 domain-containing protein [Alteromonadaceae bacterium]
MFRSFLVRTRRWLHETDKLQHIIVSLVLVQAGASILTSWQAAMLAFAIGWMKELGDKWFSAGFSWGDILANTLGIALGLILLQPWL